ncbi:nuclear transport factor 2 family protein [Marinobacter sp. CHS3-4]|uniref:nuclear transport factor 2 family protein n=1 Tax=Marinobacter sp. CHS3-4 TaxID=3045174 RepID=UPI0024B5D24A|nr:nuclear transport factor 2 family protein [Marinobacter sp. CHS3-4]MDI9245443.1 nuclear transport factor 2 family protein [Marinobacter sp. CHS3-4]
MSTASVIDMGKGGATVTQTLKQFTQLFNNLSSGNVKDIRNVYSDDVKFQDPFSSVNGIEDLTAYFSGAYANVISCHFDFGEPVINGRDVCIPWIMRLRHKRIRSGKQVNVDGISQLAIHNGKVTHHRDYFDVGQLLYENLPVLGKAIRWIRSKAG